MKWVKEYIRKRRIEKWKKEVEKIAVVTAACSNMKFKFFNCDLKIILNSHQFTVMNDRSTVEWI